MKILTVGKKGREQLRRDMRQARSSATSTSRRSSGSATPTPRPSPRTSLHRYDAGEFDVCTIFYNRFQSVISQIPTARQLIPAVFEGRRRRVGALYEYEPDEEAILAELLPRGVATQIFTALLENGRLRAGRPDERDGQRHAQRRRHDRPADHRQYNRSRQAAITKELIEIISGAEAL